MASINVGVVVGSVAKGSINRKLSQALIRLAPDHLDFTDISIGELPIYSYDYDDQFPPVATAFKDAIKSSDALLFVTPEYNRSIPGALKNAIDWATRPYGANAFSGKPAAVIGMSPGTIGTACAQQHLRNVLSYCDCQLLCAPEAYIQFRPDMINADGDVAAEGTRAFLAKFMGQYGDFVRQVLGVQQSGGDI